MKPPAATEEFSTQPDLLAWLGTQISRHGDIFEARIYGTPAYVVNRPADVERVLLKNWTNYPKGQAIKRIGLLLGNGLMVSKGELWRRQRRMIQPAFSRGILNDFIPLIVEENTRLVDRWILAANAGDRVNVTRDVSQLSLDIVLKGVFGVDYAAVAPRFQLITEEAARNFEFATAFAALGDAILEVATRRRQESSEYPDFLGLFMRARDRDSGAPMSDAQLVKEIKTLVIAGHETTASTLNWTWYLVSQHPAAEGRMLAEISERLPDIPSLNADALPAFSYVRNVIDEALRMYPAGWLLTRRAIAEDQLGEYTVPAGTEIYIAPYFIQRSPRLWEAPETFNPDRFQDAEESARRSLSFLPFSIGPRNCIGEYLARLEMQIHVILVASRLKLRYREESNPPMAAGVNLLSARDFLMHPERY
jgi:cytochrome P450